MLIASLHCSFLFRFLFHILTFLTIKKLDLHQNVVVIDANNEQTLTVRWDFFTLLLNTSRSTCIRYFFYAALYNTWMATWSCIVHGPVGLWFMIYVTGRSQKVRRSSQPISWLSTEKLNQTRQKQTCINNKIYYKVKLTHKKLKPGLVASYNLLSGNGTGLFWKK